MSLKSEADRAVLAGNDAARAAAGAASVSDAGASTTLGMTDLLATVLDTLALGDFVRFDFAATDLVTAGFDGFAFATGCSGDASLTVACLGGFAFAIGCSGDASFTTPCFDGLDFAAGWPGEVSLATDCFEGPALTTAVFGGAALTAAGFVGTA